MNGLDKQRVDVGYSQNTFSSMHNLKASSGVCQAHTLTKDVYGREVGDLGLKRYDQNCGDKFDQSQNLNSILERENAFRPNKSFEPTQESQVTESGISKSPYVTSDNSKDMRIIPNESDRSIYRTPVSYYQ